MRKRITAEARANGLGIDGLKITKEENLVLLKEELNKQELIV